MVILVKDHIQNIKEDMSDTEIKIHENLLKVIESKDNPTCPFCSSQMSFIDEKSNNYVSLKGYVCDAGTCEVVPFLSLYTQTNYEKNDKGEYLKDKDNKYVTHQIHNYNKMDFSLKLENDAKLMIYVDYEQGKITMYFRKKGETAMDVLNKKNKVEIDEIPNFKFHDVPSLKKKMKTYLLFS